MYKKCHARAKLLFCLLNLLLLWSSRCRRRRLIWRSLLSYLWISFKFLPFPPPFHTFFYIRDYIAWVLEEKMLIIGCSNWFLFKGHFACQRLQFHYLVPFGLTKSPTTFLSVRVDLSNSLWSQFVYLHDTKIPLFWNFQLLPRAACQMPQNIHVKSTTTALNSYVDHDASRST